MINEMTSISTTTAPLQGKVRKISLLLHDIRSVYNVGSIFRTADAFAVEKVYISGYTPGPLDRFGRKRADISKVALGAEETVPWERVSVDVATFISHFKAEKNKEEKKACIVALEQNDRSIDIKDIGQKVGDSSVLLILGREVEGISAEILSLADIVAEIPMYGRKESLNVSVAAGIGLFALIR